ncbi:MAG: glycoside hydrolase family 88 protein [Bacteroidales bacterium]|nr:glycoside hydrolase family 88 protein [Bacteroidales bacterium]
MALVISCGTQEKIPVNKIAALSAVQCSIMEPSLTEDTMPRNFQNGELVLSDTHWWCSGFFPGVCWYSYKLGGGDAMKEMALRQTAKLLDVSRLTGDHDLGFQVLPSAGEAYAETGDTIYLNTIRTAAAQLAGRFSPVTGVMKSWNRKDVPYPVIIDNMMNLELLTRAAKLCNEPQWREIAITHARTTIRNHFRPDYSSYHMVVYNPEDGTVISRQTVQGYADESAWSRGQAWGLYGYTMMYRETGEEEFLQQAENIAAFLLPKLEGRPVPPWDFDAPEESIGQDDASAGAIMASALFELATLTKDASLSERYRKQAETTLSALCGEKYLAKEGECGGFILKHSTGHYPKGGEVDVPLTYGDYYFMEAVWRYKNL